MRRTRSLILLILALAMVLALFTGCGNSAADGNSTETDAPSIEASEAPGSNGDNKPSDAGSENPFEAVSLPITEELETLSLWYCTHPIMFSYIESSSDMLVFQELERRTNIEIEFVDANVTSATEEFNLMLTSGEYCDMLSGATNYFASYGGIDWGVEEDIIVPLNDYIDEFAPAYSATIDMYADEYYGEFYSDGGNLGGFWMVQATEPKLTTGMVIRQDWMDALSLETPETFDEWTEVLTALKSEYDLEAAYFIDEKGTDNLSALGLSPLSTENNVKYFTLRDDTVVSVLDDEELLKNYLSRMNDWYESGIISADFMTFVESNNDNDAYLLSGKSAAALVDFDQIYSFAEQSSDPEYRLMGINRPVMNSGDTVYVSNAEHIIDTAKGYILTSACDDIETACRFVNYLYTDEGSLLCNYGIEGETFEYDSDGNPHLTDLVINNPDGIAVNFTLNMYCMQAGPFRLDSSRQRVGLTDDQTESIETWSLADSSCILPNGITLTSDEAAEVGGILGDASTYFEENFIKFIVGSLNPEGSDWENFIGQLKSMNVDRAKEIYQSAMDRYSARG